MLSSLASDLAPYQRNIIIQDVLALKVSMPFGIMTFNPANCSWEELNMESVDDLSGSVCNYQHQSYISTSDWKNGNAFFAYCNNNNEIKIR